MLSLLYTSTLLAGVWARGSFAHITDLHYDSQYKVGVNTLGYCRSTEPGTSGRFGTSSNKCDSPLSLITDTLVWVATRKPKVDFVLATGDFARRTRADELHSQVDQMAELSKASDLLADLVSSPLRVLPAIGASDLWPEGDCAANDPQFALLANTTWAHFLNPWMDSANHESFLQYGCYNATIDGFGVIILNTEFWSFSNGADGAGSSTCDDGHVGDKVFRWAESVLQGYQAQGMKVLIAGNRVYSAEYEGTGYRPICATRYINMSVVYEDSIIGHVFGGLHEDSFSLITNNVDARKPNVTGVVHVSPAVVPVYNPAIRIYEYAAKGEGRPPGTLMDYVQYYADIVQANLAAQLIYKEEYRATAAYELPDFSITSWLHFFNRLQINATLRHKYDMYKTVSSDASQSETTNADGSLIGGVFAAICGVVVLLAGGVGWYKCRSFKYKTYEQELAEGLR